MIHESNIWDKVGLKRKLRVLFDWMMYDEYNDDYQGYEEKGISYEEWKLEKNRVKETQPHINDVLIPEEIVIENAQ